MSRLCVCMLWFGADAWSVTSSVQCGAIVGSAIVPVVDVSSEWLCLGESRRLTDFFVSYVRGGSGGPRMPVTPASSRVSRKAATGRLSSCSHPPLGKTNTSRDFVLLISKIRPLCKIGMHPVTNRQLGEPRGLPLQLLSSEQFVLESAPPTSSLPSIADP
jgi:hypothetical protein